MIKPALYMVKSRRTESRIIAGTANHVLQEYSIHTKSFIKKKKEKKRRGRSPNLLSLGLIDSPQELQQGKPFHMFIRAFERQPAKPHRK